MFHAILASDLPPAEKSLDRLEQEGRETITAGSETASRILSGMCFFLLTSPDALKRLRDELAPVMADAVDGIPELAKVERLPWLVRHL